MRLVPICALMLVTASVISLVARGQSARLKQQTWSCASRVLPERTTGEWTSAIPTNTVDLFRILPLPLRQKLGSKLWNAIELMALRIFLVRHIAPAFLLPAFLGFVEGSWSRSHQEGLIKLHSPVQFSCAVGGLELVPVLIGLWLVAPIWVPVTLFVWSIFALLVFSIRNLVIHAPTRL